jgi:hypothetical protein
VLFCVLCLTVVPLPPATNPFVVKINNNNNNNNNNNIRAPLHVWDSQSASEGRRLPCILLK